ncbi:MAG: membrane protein insertion efficiency factor YidD [Bdellovibrionales bacterium]
MRSLILLCPKWFKEFGVRARDLSRVLILFAIRFYQTSLRAFVGGQCRFEPSCSCYAHEAFARLPLHQAFSVTVKRLLKCHPFGSFGFDPVPERVK